jgi:hypothetical protein
MAVKTGTWFILVGVFIAFVGLLFLPSAFGPNPDENMLGAGAVVVATGLLSISSGVYLKARFLGASSANSATAGKRNRKASCDRCAQDEPVIQCRVHQIHLCADCLADHYDFRSCAYVPSTRRGTTKSSVAALSQTSSA